MHYVLWFMNDFDSHKSRFNGKFLPLSKIHHFIGPIDRTHFYMSWIFLGLWMVLYCVHNITNSSEPAWPAPACRDPETVQILQRRLGTVPETQEHEEELFPGSHGQAQYGRLYTQLFRSVEHGATKGRLQKKKNAYFMTSGKKVGGPRTKTKFQKKI